MADGMLGRLLEDAVWMRCGLPAGIAPLDTALADKIRVGVRLKLHE
jgi:hypothetical protein